jgi:hypothetical protein
MGDCTSFPYIRAISEIRGFPFVFLLSQFEILSRLSSFSWFPINDFDMGENHERHENLPVNRFVDKLHLVLALPRFGIPLGFGLLPWTLRSEHILHQERDRYGRLGGRPLLRRHDMRRA